MIIMLKQAPFVEEFIFKVLFTVIMNKDLKNSYKIQIVSPLIFSICKNYLKKI